MRLLGLTTLAAAATTTEPCAAQLSQHPWLSFTFPRSGSGWFVETLTKRSTLRGTHELYFKKLKPTTCASGTPSQECECSIQTALSKGEGYKFMLKTPSRRFADQRGHPALDGVARAVCSLKIPYIFLWRRNVLRRLISYDANRLDMKRRSHHAHPTSETEADQQRSTKPHLNASGISHYIGLEITARQKAEKAFSKYCGAEDSRSRIHYYEDLVDGAPGSDKAWALVLKQLRTSPISSTTSAANFTIIRGKRPPLESVANPDEIRAALANSRHAWMLEEKDMFDRLQSTHAHSPPPRDPRRLTQPSEAPEHVACLGDSLTRGDGAHESPGGRAARGRRGRGNYPALLGAALGDLFYRVRNFGHGGATASSYRHVTEYVRAKQWAPDIELWMLGTNDSKDFDRKRYVDDYRRAIEGVKKNASRPRVVVMSPPPVLAGRWHINPAIIDDVIPGAAWEVAAAVGAHFFDLHRWFSAAAGCRPRTPACAAHFVPDGVHTNEKGTALIAKLARRALAETCIVPGKCISDFSQGYHRCKPCVPTA